MATESLLQQAVRIILDQRRQKLAPVNRSLGKVREFLNGLDTLETILGESMTTKLPPDLGRALPDFPMEQVRKMAKEAEIRLKWAAQRLSRDSINIGVAGQARQGKSTLLKSFSGLDDNAIPAGGGDFCTAARSEIRNSGQRRATIVLHDRTSFFRETVLPYFDAFGLTPVPNDLQEFLSRPLPAMPESASARDRNLYLTLVDIRQSTPSIAQLLTGERKSVALHDVRQYVTKDKGNREYLAVQQAIVEAKFPYEGLPSELRLIDLPGLGELALNIGTDLMRAVADQADMVIVVRKPGAQGDGWNEKDAEILDIMRKAVPDLDLRDWLALTLNHADVQGDKNTVNVENMLRTSQQRDLGGIAIWPCDCSKPGEVRGKVIEPAMRMLTERAGALDQSRLRMAAQALEQFRGIAVPALEGLQTLLAANSGAEIDAGFETRVAEFRKNLRGTLRKMLGEIRRAGEGDKQIESIFQEELERLTGELGRVADGAANAPGYSPWSVGELTDLLSDTSGGATARDWAAVNTRLALTRFLGSRLDPVFKREVLGRKRQVASILLSQRPLSSLVSVLGVDSTGDEDIFSTIGRILPDRFQELKKAFARFGAFDITYDLNFHPLVRKKLHRLDPDEPEYNAEGGLGRWQAEDIDNMDYAAVAGQLRTVMDTVAAELVYSLVEDRSARLLGMQDTLYYTVKEFLDQILWSDQAEHEWKRLLFENRRQLWADAYADRDAADRIIQNITRSVNALHGLAV